MVEVCPTGTFFAYPARLKHFKMDIYSDNGVIIKVADVLKGIICILLFFLILYFVVILLVNTIFFKKKSFVVDKWENLIFFIWYHSKDFAML